MFAERLKRFEWQQLIMNKPAFVTWITVTGGLVALTAREQLRIHFIQHPAHAVLQT